jgi:heme/copper-type cytochrome/quinol oxidase subunit 2
MIVQGQNFGKWFIYAGLGLIAIGLLVWLSGKMGISLGKLPGDIHVQKEKFSFHFPIATSILISILLTILLNLIFWLFRK